MIDMMSAQDVPPGVMDLLRIFLAASSRGEEAVLILETRRKTISTKFRSFESPVGVPAAPANITLKEKKKNPARARRSKLRLEKFMEKKKEDKKQAESSPATGTSSDSDVSKLVIQLDKMKDRQDRSVGADLTSPIPQLDGAVNKVPDTVLFDFVSDYHQDDINYALEELFPSGCAKLIKCVAPNPRKSADQLCTVAVRKTAGQDTFWPEMKENQALVFRDLALQ